MVAAAGSMPRRGRPPAFAGVDRGILSAVRSAPVAAVDGEQALLERDTALGRIDQRLRDAIAGGGSLLLVEGPAGIGKTRLVLAAARHGRELGLTTLSARGSELERDFAYGLVRQLFEAPLVAAPPPERAELLAGAAGHAASLFGVAAAPDDAAGALLDPSFAILHGLYWLSANLGRRTPLLLCVDDVHWADQASLRFLHYLGRRLQELPIAVVAATRQARSADGSPLLAVLAADPSAEVVELAPLSQRAVAELMRLAFGTEVEPAFAAACHEATGGVPFLVRELIRAIAGQGIEPTAAASSRVAGLAPRAVSHSVVQRLGRLSASARELARAAAVLGEADLRLAVGLAGVDPGTAATAADELAAAGILEEGRPLRFVHPIVRAAVEADLSPAGRAGLHAAAAGCLANEGASAHRIAAHLLATDPAGDDRVADSLLSAARTAIANGAPDSAVAYLRRALAEPPSERLRPDVLLELGFAESYAADPQAAAHLEAALDIAPATTAQVSITLALGRMLQIGGRNREALAVFDRTRARLTGTDRRAALTLEGAALGAAQLDAQTADEAAPRIARLRRLAEEEPDVPPSVFGMLAFAAANANEPAETAARLALRALDGAPKLLPEAVDRPPFFYHACIALTFAERHGEALARFDEALADARRLGSLPHVLGLSCYRALVHLRTGDLANAEADARVALETSPRPPGVHAAVALAVLLETLAERGQSEAAEEADQRYRLAEQFPTMVHGGSVLAARGRLRLAERRPAAALGDLLAAGDLFARLRSPTPSIAPWRSDAALAHLALGKPAEARALAAEEVTLARAFKGLRTLGVALRAAGLTDGGQRGIELLRQAVRVLEGSGARLEHARAMADLGAALRRAGQRAESREILRAALDLAHRCGALALTERARTELAAAGGRPRRLVLSGLDSLTPSERRVAQLAAGGLSNRDIAQNLFITARTVEGHLTHAYQKLAITSREQLPAALAPPGGEATATAPIHL
jgi:DNA-binding CsgD family transcriptional regulator/Tfp pilus assembly protein PilF